MKGNATRRGGARPAADVATRTKRRLAQKRQARAAQNARRDEVARLVAEGRFEAAREMMASFVRGETGDPRTRLNPDPSAAPLQRPVFVCGLHRSGTTLLVDRLKARFDLAWLQNIHVPEGEGQFVQDVYPQEMPFGGPGSFAFAPQMRLRPVTDRDRARAQAERLSACWGSVAGGGSRLLEKSPSNIVRIGYLRSLFPDARFVVWTRDPRAVSLATQKWRRRVDLMTLMLHWSTAYLAAFEDLQDDCVIVRYEDFCEDPEGELERIGRFCGLAERDTPLPSQERFEEIRNSNQKYVADFPVEAQRIPGFATWELFGYHLGRDRGVAATAETESSEADAEDATDRQVGPAGSAQADDAPSPIALNAAADSLAPAEPARKPALAKVTDSSDPAGTSRRRRTASAEAPNTTSPPASRRRHPRRGKAEEAASEGA